MSAEFKPFGKIPRFNRECIVTEKIDGTNALLCIADTGEVLAGSRTRWIAKDVIAALEVGKIKAGFGYGAVSSDKILPADLKSQLAVAKSCEVCAMGAVLVACVARDNDFVPTMRWSGDTYAGWRGSQVIDRLAGFFSEKTLRHMERAFEFDPGYGEESEMGFTEETPRERMVAIMQNIIDKAIEQKEVTP